MTAMIPLENEARDRFSQQGQSGIAPREVSAPAVAAPVAPASVGLVQKLTQRPLKIGPISGFRLAFPNREDAPAGGLQGNFIGGIALNVAGYLLAPIFRVRFWLSRAPAAVMSMPEATVDKDGLAARPEDKVWLSGEVFAVEPVPVAHGVNQPAHDHLGLRVRGFDRSHDVAADWISRCRLLRHSQPRRTRSRPARDSDGRPAIEAALPG